MASRSLSLSCGSSRSRKTVYDVRGVHDPANDPATFAAHLIRGAPGDLGQALASLEVFLEGYGSRPVNLEWYLGGAILRRAGFPFRLVEPDWPARVEGMVSAAEDVLQ